MTRHLSFALCGVFLAVGCKGETVIKPDPQTQADLDKCKKDKDDLDAYKKKLEAENAQLLQKGSGAEIVVTIEGDLMKVKLPPTGTNTGGPPVDPKIAEAASKNFQNVVEKSRGAIQKCYEQALKKNT